MLNERQEYLEYSCELSQAEHGRLEYAAFVNNKLSGKARAELIVARHFLEVFRGLPLEEQIGRITAVLRLYASETACVVPEGERGAHDGKETRYAEEIRAQYPEIVDWLRRYVQEFFINRVKDPINKKEVKEQESKRKSAEQLLQTTLNGANGFAGKDYEDRIADALNQGFLRRYYLCCKEDCDPERLWEKVLYRTDKHVYRLADLKTEKRRKQKHQDAILKLTAGYLLAGGGVDRAYCPVSMVDVVNWMTDIHKVREIKGRYEYQEESGKCFPLFLSEQLPDLKETMLCLDEGWLRAGGWRIIEEADLERELAACPGMHFWSDLGSGCYLAEGQWYS
ncbi:MAG: hypothetical protein IJ794_09615 [Lachnospiraceae bacterium]|nr:hypothetical protein [Lachnospiraceae bacterium]